MRFAFISTMRGWPWGGSEELWSQAATQLNRRGTMCRHRSCTGRSCRTRSPCWRRHGITIKTHSSPQGGPARRIWNKLSLSDRRSYGRLKRFNPDMVVISQGHNSGGFDWAKVCRESAIPYVIIVHCNSELFGYDDQEIGEAVASYTGARRVFCVSRSNLDLLRLQVGEPLLNGEVVCNPYNVSPEHPPAWPDESEKWRLACVARIDPAAKGQDLLLQTLAPAGMAGPSR